MQFAILAVESSTAFVTSSGQRKTNRCSEPQHPLRDGRKSRGINCGGIGAMHLLARRVGLRRRDRPAGLHLLKMHLPYHESDHVLNIAYNVAVRRHVPRGHRAAAQRRGVPRRAWAPSAFLTHHRGRLLPTLRRVRHRDLDGGDQRDAAACLESSSPASFFERGVHRRRRHDGRRPPASARRAWTSPTRACGATSRWWSRWPTRSEPLYLVNRSGNRPVHEGACRGLDRADRAVPRAGFREIMLRGDTDFSLDAATWTAGTRTACGFIFGYRRARRTWSAMADGSAGKGLEDALERPAKYEVQTEPRRDRRTSRSRSSPTRATRTSG